MTETDVANAGEFLRWISYIILLGIFAWQIYSFRNTRRKIENYANVFPKPNAEDKSYPIVNEDDKEMESHGRSVSNENEEYAVINKLIDEYKNIYERLGKGLKAKYKEGKEIIEEHLEKVEDTIHRSLATPLYLGLMGTIVGVVFGLWEYTEVMKAAESFKSLTGIAIDTSSAIDYIIGSVQIAMIVTFTGLFFYVINSTQKFSKAKDAIEERKVSFYNNELRQKIPFDVEGGLAEIVESMRQNLTSFNGQLSDNLKNMNTSFDNSVEIIRDLPKLQKILNGISSNVVHFERFDTKFNQVNNCLDKMGEFLEKICKYNNDIEMTRSFYEIAGNLKVVVDKMNNGIEGNDQILKTLEGKITDFNRIANAAENIQTSISQNARDFNNNLTYAAENVQASISQNARDFNDKLAHSFDNIEESVDELKDDFGKQWKDANAYMGDSIRKMADYLGVLDKYVSDFNMKLKESIDVQVGYISRSFVDNFTPILNHIGSLKENLSNDQLKNLANEVAIAEMERITVAMTKSFNVVYENMKLWQEKITENIKTDIEKRVKENAKGELENSIASLDNDLKTLNHNLEVVIANTKPRNIFKIIFGIG
jgi:hypothetical protein